MRPSAPFVACGHKKGNGLTPVGFSIFALPGSQAFHYGAPPLYPVPDPRMACGQIDVYGGRGGGALPRPAPFHLLLPTILLWGWRPYAPQPPTKKPRHLPGLHWLRFPVVGIIFFRRGIRVSQLIGACRPSSCRPSFYQVVY